MVSLIGLADRRQGKAISWKGPMGSTFDDFTGLKARPPEFRPLRYSRNLGRNNDFLPRFNCSKRDYRKSRSHSVYSSGA